MRLKVYETAAASIIAVSILAGCSAESESAGGKQAPKQQKAQGAKDMTTAALNIEGMTCEACVKRCQKALSEVEGVRSAVVNLEQKKAVVEYDPGAVDTKRLTSAVEAAGFKATPAK